MKKLLQLLATNARGDKAPPIRAEAGKVYVYDVIDRDWGASAKGLIDALATMAGQPVALHINSPGGDVFEARAMVAAIRAHGAPVTTYIDGLAASAATYLALAGDKVHITDGGLFMVHNSWTLAWGNKHEMRTTADLLDKIDGTIANDYARKTGASAEQIAAWMDAETWFTAAEAKAAGFVDEVTGADDGSKAARWNLSAYTNAPKIAAKAPAPKAEKSDDLTARQAALYDAFEDVAKEYGPFDQTSGPAGAHYMAAADNPFVADGLKCSNCSMYSGARGCELVAGDIDPDALCKLWIIPAAVLTQSSAVAAQAERLQKLNRSRLAAMLLPN